MSMEQRAEYRRVLVQVSGSVATITLNHPERKNALGPDMVNELCWALDDARDDPAVRVVVLTGAGQAFCAGADLSQVGSGQGPSLPSRGDYAELLLRFVELGKPVIARVVGPAMGGGLGLCASAHFAIAAESAVFATPEIHRGLFPMQIMAVLDRIVPRRKLMELMLVGEKIDARTALEFGLVTRVVPDQELDAAVDELARRLVKGSPTAMRMGLAAYHRQAGKPLHESLPQLRSEFMALFATEDAREGLAAFMQKREPKWTGR